MTLTPATPPPPGDPSSDGATQPSISPQDASAINPRAAFGAATGAPPVFRQPGTNPFAVAALVLSLCGGAGLAMALGIVALVQIRKSGQDGKGVAIAGIAISACWLAFAGAIVAVVVVRGPDTEPPRATDTGLLSLSDVRAGDCVPTVPAVNLGMLEVVDCEQPHLAEVFAVFELSGRYPGEATVRQDARDGCHQRLAGYAPAAVDHPLISVAPIVPSSASWSRGERLIVCLARSAAGSRTSLRG